MVEVITKIKTAEENAEELRKTARRTAAQMKEDALSRGKQLLDSEGQRAAKESAEIMAKAEEQAKAYLQESHESSRQLCDELAGAAKAKMDEAAKFIVERIVGSL